MASRRAVIAARLSGGCSTTSLPASMVRTAAFPGGIIFVMACIDIESVTIWIR